MGIEGMLGSESSGLARQERCLEGAWLACGLNMQLLSSLLAELLLQTLLQFCEEPLEPSQLPGVEPDSHGRLSCFPRPLQGLDSGFKCKLVSFLRQHPSQPYPRERESSGKLGSNSPET